MIWIVVVILGVIALATVLVELSRDRLNPVMRQAAPGKIVRLSQGRTHYQWHGPVRGPVAVCVHGLTTPSLVWDDLIPGLTGLGYRVLTYDLYGRGLSDRVSGAQDGAFFLTQLRDLLDDQQIKDEITLLGYSMGGSIGAMFAAEEGHRLQRLVLIAPAGLARVRDATRLSRLRGTPILGDVVGRLIDPVILRRQTKASDAPKALKDRVLAETQMRGYNDAVLQSRRGLLAQDLMHFHRDVAQTNLPVLAVWGRDDDVIPLDSVGRLAEVNRAARQVVVDGAGHGVLYTHVEQVTDAIRTFLRET